MKIKLALIALLLIVGFAAVPTSEAACAGYELNQWNATLGTYNYSWLGADADATYPSIVGRFWQPANYAAFNQGPYDASQWFTTYGASAYFYVHANTGEGSVIGCSSGNVYTVVETKTTDGKSAKFFSGGVSADFASAIVWDMSTLGDWNFVEVAKPTVAVANKAGSVLTLNVTPANLTGGYLGTIPTAITGYRIMRSAAAGNPPGIDVGRVPGAWTLVQRVNPGTPLTGYTFDCATLGTGQDLFLAVQMEFDNAQVLGSYVGASTQVRCNSTLAKPGLGEKPKPKLR